MRTEMLTNGLHVQVLAGWGIQLHSCWQLPTGPPSFTGQRSHNTKAASLRFGDSLCTRLTCISTFHLPHPCPKPHPRGQCERRREGAGFLEVSRKAQPADQGGRYWIAIVLALQTVSFWSEQSFRSAVSERKPQEWHPPSRGHTASEAHPGSLSQALSGPWAQSREEQRSPLERLGGRRRFTRGRGAAVRGLQCEGLKGKAPRTVPHGRRSLAGYRPRGRKSQTRRKRLSTQARDAPHCAAPKTSSCPGTAETTEGGTQTWNLPTPKTSASSSKWPTCPPLPRHRLPGKPPRVKALSFLIQMIPRTSYVAHFKSEPYCPQSNQHDLEKTHMSVCHSRRSKPSRRGSPLRQIRQLKTHVLTAAGQHPASAAILRTSLTSPPLLPSLLFPQHWPPCCSLDPHGSGPSLHLEYSLQGGWRWPPPLLQASHSNITPCIAGHCIETHITMRSIESGWESVEWCGEPKPVLCDHLEEWDGEGDGREVQQGGGIGVPLTASWWLRRKESACNAGDPPSIPGSGRSPGEGNG